MRRAPKDFTANEARNIREFVAKAVHLAGGEIALSERSKISQATINNLKSGTKGAGYRSLRNIAAATSTKIDEILSGVGLEKLNARGISAADAAQAEERLAAFESLARLYRIPVSEVTKVLDELGLELPPGVPATTLFDVGRAAIERRRAGLPLTRPI